MPDLSRYAKFITALVGVAIAAGAEGLLDAQVVSWIVLVATVLGVYAVPNATPAEQDSTRTLPDAVDL
jgi:hypothetical protein